MFVAVPAGATDQPIAASKLVLRRTGSTQRLTFTSKDPAVPFPAIGGPDDPSATGATIELFSAAEPGGASLSVPAGVGNPGWTVRDATIDSYQYRNSQAPAGPSVARRIVLKQAKTLRITAAATGLTLATLQGTVGIRVTIGTLRSCARFDAPTIVRDEPGRFVARNAPPPPDCSDASLGGTTTSTTTSQPSGTTVPTCGDGVKNQPSEQCDGDAHLFADCGVFAPTFGCGAPGASNECTCCTNGSFCNAGTGGTLCCDPDASCLVMGIPSNGGTVCYDPTCGPGDDCSLGQACVDGQCCVDGPGTCFFEPSGDFIPCCPPNVCLPVPGGGVCGPPP
jgi:hypothetical protein